MSFNPGVIHSQLAHDEWIDLLDSEAVDTPPELQLPADGWDAWDEGCAFDDTAVIVATSQPLVADVAALPYQDQVVDFTREEGYEDPITDLVGAAIGPVMPNAPPLDQPADDPWPWADEAIDDPQHLDAPPLDANELAPDDEWPWFEEATGDELPPDDAEAVADLAIDLAPDDEWPWFDDSVAEAPTDETDTEPPADPPATAPTPTYGIGAIHVDDGHDPWWHDLDATLGADAAPPPEPPSPDAWTHHGDEVEDADHYDDFGNEDLTDLALDEPPLPDEPDADDWWHALAQPAPADAAAPALQPPADEPDVVDLDADVWWHDLAAPLGDDEPALPGELPEDADDLDADDWWHRLDAIVPADVASVDLGPQQEPEHAELDADDWWHALDAGTPADVGLLATVLQDEAELADVDADDWWHGADAAAPAEPADLPPSDAWAWDEPAVDDPLDADVSAVEQLEALPLTDAWPWWSEPQPEAELPHELSDITGEDAPVVRPPWSVPPGHRPPHHGGRPPGRQAGGRPGVVQRTRRRN